MKIYENNQWEDYETLCQFEAEGEKANYNKDFIVMSGMAEQFWHDLEEDYPDGITREELNEILADDYAVMYYQNNN